MPTTALPQAAELGVALRRWRLLHRVKQAHAAQLFSVAQSTISRWENGLQAMNPDEQARLGQLLGARLSAAADQALARLVEGSQQPVHLVCDLSHRLLACSPARAAEFSLPLSALMGRSLWRFSSEAIIQREASLQALGWREQLAPPALAFDTGCNRSRVVPISAGTCRWTRLILADGSAARLVETLA
ncbi:helix-turn-helix domain-containing protein [Pseudomonas xantholysinigenes]|jgi:transcriptional regulator with XRE-family HTH domain|uniref:Helix-turn-helix domain-containing protein n=1 Tax=Pseudomonas xantholysinigenes TaxID=2745490 RepID=A0A9E6PSM5_9PSED|nr:helix-turn-helix transcriptional regulator [Pseudomonas xantholysinigenes]QXI36496.1 helix-turn-helix domain-containing protein [Pseudomonas xantholysinigenes]